MGVVEKIKDFFWGGEETIVDEDIYEPIPMEARVPWYHMFWIFVGMWVSLYSVAIGYSIGRQLSPKLAIIATILGYLIAGIAAAFVSEIGRTKGLPSYVLAKAPLGFFGQLLIAAIMFVIIGFGSLGLQADAVGRMWTSSVSFLSGHRLLVSGILCTLMMLSAIRGIKGLAYVSWSFMPFFYIMIVLAAYFAVKNYPGGLSAILAIQRHEMSFSRAVFLNAGAWAGFVMLMADVSRFLKSRKESFILVPTAFVIGGIPPALGVILGATLDVELELVWMAVGVGSLFAMLGIVASTGAGWTTNDNNAYTAGLALATLTYPWRKLTRRQATTIVAILGVLGAMTGIGTLKVFEWIAAFHGSFNMSFVGVLVAHYFIVAKDKEIQTKGLAGILAWLISGLLAYFHIIPYEFVTGALTAFVLYLVFYYGVERPLFGEQVVDRVRPTVFWKSQSK